MNKNENEKLWVEKYRPQDAFTDAVKALYVFGAKIVRPAEIVVIKTKK